MDSNISALDHATKRNQERKTNKHYYQRRDRGFSVFSNIVRLLKHFYYIKLFLTYIFVFLVIIFRSYIDTPWVHLGSTIGHFLNFITIFFTFLVNF